MKKNILFNIRYLKDSAGEESEREVELSKGKPYVIGRNVGDWVIPDPKISRKHCHLVIVGENIVLKDLESANGTFVNEEKIDRLEIQNNDVIKIGFHELKVLSILGEDEVEKTASQTFQVDSNQADDLEDKLDADEDEYEDEYEEEEQTVGIFSKVKSLFKKKD